MKKTLQWLAIGLAVIVGSPAVAAVNIVTTTTDLAAIARAVGGDLVTAESLTRGTQDPHYAEAKPSMIRKVFDADLLLVVGADLEIGWLPAVLRAGRNPDIMPGTLGFLDLSTVVPLLDVPSGPVDRSMGDVHPYGNPHYWLNPENGAVIARAVAARLSALDPANADQYDAGLAAFESNLSEKLTQWRQAMAPLVGVPVIAYHKSLLYLSDAFGFRIADYVEAKPGIAPSARQLDRLINLIEAEKVTLLLREMFYERQSTQYLAEQTGIRIAELPPSVGAEDGVETYFDLFDAIIAAIRSSGAI